MVFCKVSADTFPANSEMKTRKPKKKDNVNYFKMQK